MATSIVGSNQRRTSRLTVTSTGSVTVNAAFLQEIKADNIALRQLLDRTSHLLDGSPLRAMPPRELAELLATLRDQLATHFSLEEAFGYFEDAVSVAPRLEHKARRLREQHVALFVALGQIVDDAERWLYGETSAAVVDRIAVRYQSFQDQLRRHECEENELILEAADDDIGVGD